MSLTQTALVLESGEPSGSDGAVWVPAQSDEQILSTHGECLVYVDALGGDDLNGWTDRLKLELDAKYPSEHPLLGRLKIEAPYSYENKKNHGYQHRLQKVIVAPAGDRMYRGDSPEDVCMLAKVFGDIQVPDSAFAIKRSWATDHTEVLEEQGCYWRSCNGAREVVHNPKVIARRIRRDKKLGRKNDKEKGSGRAVPWIMCIEFFKAIDPIVKLLASNNCVERYKCHPWKLCSYSRLDRHGIVSLWTEAIDMFNKVFGKSAHRHMPCFQEFLKVWKKLGPATKKSFDAYSGGWRGGDSGGLFNFLDYELTVRKPRNRKWTLEQTLDNRTDDLWLSVEQRAELTKQAEKAKKKKKAGKEKAA